MRDFGRFWEIPMEKGEGERERARERARDKEREGEIFCEILKCFERFLDILGNFEKC